MTARASIRNTLIDTLQKELTASNKGSKYYTDIDMAVSGKSQYLDQIDTFPAIGVGLGPERMEYLPGGLRWNYLTLYIRCYVKSEDESDELLELLIHDIKTIIDSFEVLPYTINQPDGTSVEKSVTKMTVLGITTDEGLLRPIGVGEVQLELQYSGRDARR